MKKFSDWFQDSGKYILTGVVLVLLVLVIAFDVREMRPAESVNETWDFEQEPLVEMSMTDETMAEIPEEESLPVVDATLEPLLDGTEPGGAVTTDEAAAPVTMPVVEVAPMTDESIETVEAYFAAVNADDIETACDLMVDTKCVSTSTAGMERFGEEFGKLDKGYEDVEVYRTPEAKAFDKDVVCVEYLYRYAESTNPLRVKEVMSYYLEDGEIGPRVCEMRERENGDPLNCPIEARRNFCIDTEV